MEKAISIKVHCLADAGRRGGQDFKWLQEVRRMGTVADKLAAMTLLLQESAVGNLRSLDEMLRWVNKRSGARAVAGQLCFPSHTLGLGACSCILS